MIRVPRERDLWPTGARLGDHAVAALVARGDVRVGKGGEAVEFLRGVDHSVAEAALSADDVAAGGGAGVLTEVLSSTATTARAWSALAHPSIGAFGNLREAIA